MDAVCGRDGEGVAVLFVVVQAAGQADEAGVHAHAEPAALVARWSGGNTLSKEARRTKQIIIDIEVNSFHVLFSPTLLIQPP